MIRSLLVKTFLVLGLCLGICSSAAADPCGGGLSLPMGSCGSLKAACAQMTDAQLLAAAFLKGNGTETGLGMCYFHDRSQCPGCACNAYIKLADQPDPSGYDGGTGCLFPPDDQLSDVVALLRQLCSEGACCCPAPVAHSEPCIQVIVWARDPRTGTCCQYPDPCSAPKGWPQFSSPTECDGASGGPAHQQPPADPR